MPATATFEDREITCLDCAQPFVFSAQEQELFQRKRFKQEPRRCPRCRAARNARRDGAMPRGSQ